MTPKTPKTVSQRVARHPLVGLLALAASAALPAMAQQNTSVTLSGILDAGVTRVSGLKGGSVTSLASGIMDGSRVKVEVVENLSPGWRALVTLEHRLELDTGLSSNRPPSGSQAPDRLSQATLLGLPAPFQPVVSAVAASVGAGIGVNQNNAFWDRQAFLGLVTPVGALLAGRQYTPAFEITATFDTFATRSAASAGQVGSIPAAVDIRLSNTLAWRVELAGWAASLMVGAGEGSAASGRFMGGMVRYGSPSFAVGLGYNTRENERGDKSLTSLVVGASAALGPGRAYLMAADIQDDNPSGLSGIAASVAPAIGPTNALLVQSAFTNALRQDAQLLHAGYRITRGVHTIYAGATQYDDKRSSNADVQSAGAAYTYSFSRRTDLNLAVARFTNARLAQAAPGGGGYLGGVTESAGVDSTSLSIGIQHRF